MKKTGYIYNPFYLQHDTDQHPENSGRLTAIDSRIKQSDLYPELLLLEPRAATAEEIGRVHDPAYLQQVKRDCEDGVRFLDADTLVCPRSYDVALLAAGAGLLAVDAVLDGTADTIFCAVRPPGHHAESNRAMGFCLFNNVAVAARYAQTEKGLERIFIFDWDVHHGNGTQHSFYTDSTVYYSSVHQYPFYPGTGAAEETGSGDGLGTTLNFPVAAYTGDQKYLDWMENKLVPEILRYRPELILLSAGFDAHQDDPLANIQLTTEGYGKMTDLLIRAANEVCGGRVVALLEGGYNYTALSDSVLTVLDHFSRN